MAEIPNSVKKRMEQLLGNGSVITFPQQRINMQEWKYRWKWSLLRGLLMRLRNHTAIRARGRRECLKSTRAVKELNMVMNPSELGIKNYYAVEGQPQFSSSQWVTSWGLTVRAGNDVSTGAENVVYIRCQATSIEATEELLCAVVNSIVRKLWIALNFFLLRVVNIQ